MYYTNTPSIVLRTYTMHQTRRRRVRNNTTTCLRSYRDMNVCERSCASDLLLLYISYQFFFIFVVSSTGFSFFRLNYLTYSHIELTRSVAFFYSYDMSVVCTCTVYTLKIKHFGCLFIFSLAFVPASSEILLFFVVSLFEFYCYFYLH